MPKTSTRSKRKPTRAGTRPARDGRSRPARGTRRAAPARARSARSGAARGRSPAQDAVPNGIGLLRHHMDYTTHDLEAVQRFYTETLGFGSFDRHAYANYLYVRVSPTSSLGFMPPMPGPPEQWQPPREPSLYFIVGDVDAACAALERKGVTLEQPPADMPWGHRVAMLRDPEGRMVCLARPKELDVEHGPKARAARKGNR